MEQEVLSGVSRPVPQTSTALRSSGTFTRPPLRGLGLSAGRSGSLFVEVRKTLGVAGLGTRSRCPLSESRGVQHSVTSLEVRVEREVPIWESPS